MDNMGYRWRAPKKNDNKAWKRIGGGDKWWDPPGIRLPYTSEAAEQLYEKFMSEPNLRLDADDLPWEAGP